MAQESPLSATGNLSEEQYEWLASPTAPDGLIGHPNDAAPVTASATQVTVRAGLRGVVRGFPWASGATATTYSPSLTGSARTDLVVLRLDRVSGYAVGTAIRTGSAGAGAPAAVVGTTATDVYEIPLAEYDVSGGAITAVRTRAWYLGEDGQILCKSTSRPPHAPGRSALEVDTGRRILSDGTKWTNTVDDSGVTSVSLRAGFSATRNRIQRRGGVVVLSLTVQRNTIIGADTTIQVADVPAGFAPTFEIPGLARHDSSAGLTVGLRVTTGGAVFIDTPASVGINANRTASAVLTWHAA